MIERKYLRRLCLGFVTALVCASWSQAQETVPAQDEILLKSGSKILGTVTGTRDGVVTIDTDFAGKLEIELAKIASVQTVNPVLVLMANDMVVPEQPLQIQDDKVMLETTSGVEQAFAVTDMAVVNPEPWELGQGYNWTGLLSGALVTERGNSDTDELDYKLESVWRSTRDRYTVKFNGEKDKTNNNTNTENWYTQGKYDYFLKGPNYVGFQGSAEHDKFTDLDLRYLLGPFVGRQFYAEPIFSLSAEAGPAYVNEDFIEADDDDYPAAVWALNVSSNYLGGNSRLYLDNRGIWNLDDTGDVVFDTTLGLAFPLLWNFEAAAEMLLEYDSGAVGEIDELDQTYRFRIGYTW